MPTNIFTRELDPLVTTFDEFPYFRQISVILGALILSMNFYYVPCAIGNRINHYL
jgi:hypothetical protein